jgi:hypothetical protein
MADAGIWVSLNFLILLDTFAFKIHTSWGSVVYACNPSYSEGRDQEIAVQGQPGQQKQNLISKIPNTKKS